MNELSLKTQMSIQKWLDIIHRCRESGLSNRQWCQENGIQLKSYYYWLSKIQSWQLNRSQEKHPLHRHFRPRYPDLRR